MTENRKPRSGLVSRWKGLIAAGQRRLGEFVANMFLGAAASGATFVVIPAITGKTPNAVLGVIGGVVMTLTFAIFAVLVRLLTEERRDQNGKEAER